MKLPKRCQQQHGLEVWGVQKGRPDTSHVVRHQVQLVVPARVTRGEIERVLALRTRLAALAIVPAVLAVAALVSDGPQNWLTLSVVAGLLVFGALFAVNSSLHSFLILSFTKAERVTMDVGFYYMANAAGRLIGTLASGLSYQVGGLPLMLGIAAGMVALSAVAVRFLTSEEARAA